MRSSTLILLAAVALSAPALAQSTPPAAGNAQFITINDSALLTSRLIGLPVQSAAGEAMGKIEDVVFERGELAGIVLSVGELMRVGQRYTAVDPSSISLNYTEGENRWLATMNATLDQLKAAPEFRYEGKWRR
jgi:sporulation protein YlmC with PRC-barrel domain